MKNSIKDEGKLQESQISEIQNPNDAYRWLAESLGYLLAREWLRRHAAQGKEKAESTEGTEPHTSDLLQKSAPQSRL